MERTHETALYAASPAAAMRWPSLAAALAAAALAAACQRVDPEPISASASPNMTLVGVTPEGCKLYSKVSQQRLIFVAVCNSASHPVAVASVL